MASWLKAKLEEAESLLEAVDRSLQKSSKPPENEATAVSNSELHHSVDNFVKANRIKDSGTLAGRNESPADNQGSVRKHTSSSSWDVVLDGGEVGHLEGVSYNPNPTSGHQDGSPSGGPVGVGPLPGTGSDIAQPGPIGMESPTTRLGQEVLREAPEEPSKTPSNPERGQHDPAGVAIAAGVMGYQSSPLSSSAAPLSPMHKSTLSPAPNVLDEGAHNSGTSFSADRTSGMREGGGSTKAVEQLRRRLDLLSKENAQLEDLLQESEKKTEYQMKQVGELNQKVIVLEESRNALQKQLEITVIAKDVELTRLRRECEAAQCQVVSLGAEVEALREKNKEYVENGDALQGGMLEALQKQLVLVQNELVQEQRAHQTSRAAHTARERELEDRMQGSCAALAALQHDLEESRSRCRELQDAAAQLEVENLRLSRELQSSGETKKTHVAEAMKEAPELSALRYQVKRDRELIEQLTSEKRRVEEEIERIKHEAESIPDGLASSLHSQRVLQLEQQMREMSEMLYQKQLHGEQLAAEKAAQQLLLERQLLQAQNELQRWRATASHRDGPPASRGVSHDVIPMDTLGEPYQRLIRHNRIGRAVKATGLLLDRTAATAAHILRTYPLGRLLVFLYVIFIHLYVYFLIARMQKLALHISSTTSKMP